jgi:hypothetical protein
MDNAGITIAAVKEAIGFIEHMWRAWTGDLHMFMANVISDDRVCVYDVRALVHALSEGEPIEGIENITAEKQGSNYTIKINR